MRQVRIMIVDDSPTLRELIQKYIAPTGHYVFLHAGDGAEAEGHLQEAELFGEPIDLVILDWMMPLVTGFEFLQKIRASTVFTVKPVVLMLTAETSIEQINACQNLGVAQYLTKPFTDLELAMAVHKCLMKLEVKNAV